MPVVMRPLEQRWADVCQNVIETIEFERAPQDRKAPLKSSSKAEALLAAWINELTGIRVLDPACVSGNFPLSRPPTHAERRFPSPRQQNLSQLNGEAIWTKDLAWAD